MKQQPASTILQPSTLKLATETFKLLTASTILQPASLKFTTENKKLKPTTLKLVTESLILTKFNKINETKKANAQQRFAKIGVLVLNLHIVLYFCGQ